MADKGGVFQAQTQVALPFFALPAAIPATRAPSRQIHRENPPPTGASCPAVCTTVSSASTTTTSPSASGFVSQPQEGLDQAGLPAAAVPDQQVERFETKTRRTQRLEMSELNRSDHGRIVANWRAERNSRCWKRNLKGRISRLTVIPNVAQPSLAASVAGWKPALRTEPTRSSPMAQACCLLHRQSADAPNLKRL
jgi:hypothetical protein